MHYFRALTLISAILLLAGCKGVFVKNWEIAESYCPPAPGGVHLSVGDKLKTFQSSKGVDLISSGPPISLTVEDFDPVDFNYLWAVVQLPGSAVTHMECLLLERADQGNTKSLEIFLHSKPVGPVDCKTLITDTFKDAVRNSTSTNPGCPNTHRGGWRAF